ncbi:hypothetical protein A2Z33_06625 [Candidatus Gottesmanbacteria bacterium RBG_16_52_11]|uniref:histidine kinase n=1 Tax=Candidatus Gottesmanbacteria bacterium RBG_16_52_11 TaxID=1798374 RepID=A0A1F5YXN2_9BACT|nr:MAG: hypothetical protein A2Z33_06625 [Candidatus Gottesmanbacteria bacterium RBG_16_52_11]
MNVLARIARNLSRSNPSAAGNEPGSAEAVWRLEKVILDTLDFNVVVQKVVDSVLTELGYLQLGYRIVVLALIDEDSQTLRRVSISQTAEARKALEVTPVPFKDIVIPFTETDNQCIKVMKENRPYITHDWFDILRPCYSKEDARQVQTIVGIKTSMVYPVTYHGKTQGVMIFSLVKSESEIMEREKEIIRNFTDIVGLAVQHSKLYTTLDNTTKKLKELNDKLQSANTQLQELDKLKDEFVSLASHELRTPMTAIRGSLSTILEGYAGDISPQSKEFLTAAYNENDRLIRLVNNLLNISRIEAGRMNFAFQTLNLEEIISEVITNLQNVAKEKGLNLTYIREGPIPQVEADPDKVREVMINIIGNALKFTHKGGVTVRTKFDGRSVTTSITDTGSGIAKEDQDLLFKKFSQVQKTNYARPQGGTGLGLYICKIMVEGMRGKIWIESTLGVGSTFYFSLPISD